MVRFLRQAITLGFHDEGDGIANSVIVVIRLVGNGDFRFYPGQRGRLPLSQKQFVGLGDGGMAHVVLDHTTIQISKGTRLNSHAQVGRSGTAGGGVGLGFPIIRIILPLIRYPVTFGNDGKGCSTVQRTVIVLRLGGDHHRRLLRQRGQLAAILPAHGPLVAIVVTGRITDGIVSDGFPIVGGQQVFPIPVPVGESMGGSTVRSG